MNSACLKNQLVKVLALFAVFGCTSVGHGPAREPAARTPDSAFIARVEKTVAAAQDFVISIRKTDEAGSYWNRPLFMGPSYVAQYYLMLNWLGVKDSRLDPEKLRDILLSSQLPDGSWQQVKDSSLLTGSLDATVVNYWALKVMGVDINSKSLSRAREFINKKGGTESTTLFVRTLLSLFGLHSWAKTYWIPGTFVRSDFAMGQFAQWIRPHLIPIAYLRYRRVRKDMGPRYDLSEIGSKKVRVRDSLITRGLREGSEEFQTLIIKKMLKTQQPQGSWGGYTSANLFTLAALDDFSRWNPGFKEKQAELIRRAHEFVSRMLLKNGVSDYLGTVCDGRYWDTILIHRGLVDSGKPASTLFSSTDYLTHKQVANGGIPFGVEFEYAPDVDDTAEYVTALATTSPDRYRPHIRRALDWVLSMQNSDGGWGAFDRNNTGNLPLEIVTRQFKDSADHL